MKTFLVRGVPASVQTDGWWINKETGSGGIGTRGRANVASSGGFRMGALIGLITLADLMLWQVVPGLSLAVFGVVVIVVGYGHSGQLGAGGVLLASVLFLPVVEQVQVLSLLFWCVGMALGAGWIALAKWPGMGRLITAGIRFVGHAPQQIFGDLRVLTRKSALGGDLRRFLLGWALPLGMGALFVGLLLDANPMIENVISNLFELRWLSLVQAGRLVFWLTMAALIWPFLVLLKMRERLKLAFVVPSKSVVGQLSVGNSVRKPGFVNAGSVRRSLFLFNGVFALQTGMDAAYLWGGAALPEGMGYAEYAHRGAYPLLVMALMAGFFALLSRPFVVQNSVLKVVLVIWMIQTVLLVVSSLYRIDIYIEAFGLTRLRLAALVWMGLVAVGLLLVIWQVIRDNSTGWLLARVGLLGVAVLYGVCFVSFDRTIAGYNLGHDVPQDVYYLCSLGPSALPEIRKYEGLTGRRFCHSDEPRAPQFSDWREWGFRDWRVRRSLDQINIENG